MPVAKNAVDKSNAGPDDGALIEVDPPRAADNEREHIQFMEAAVAVAIQEKGLTAPSASAPSDEVIYIDSE